MIANLKNYRITKEMGEKDLHHEYINVFSKKFTGGPKNLGDPEDKTLRHVEEHVYITQIIKDRAHHEKCRDFVYKWGSCMEDNAFGLRGLFTFLICKKEVNDMNDCLKHYYKDPEFRKECENIYLERRSRHRLTGILEKDPYYKKPYYESERKKEFLAKYKAEKAKQMQEEATPTQK